MIFCLSSFKSLTSSIRVALVWSWREFGATKGSDNWEKGWNFLGMKGFGLKVASPSFVPIFSSIISFHLSAHFIEFFQIVCGWENITKRVFWCTIDSKNFVNSSISWPSFSMSLATWYMQYSSSTAFTLMSPPCLGAEFLSSIEKALLVGPIFFHPFHKVINSSTYVPTDERFSCGHWIHTISYQNNLQTHWLKD